MCKDGTFTPPEIKDDDIRWVSRLMNLPEKAFYGKDGTDPRHKVLKRMDTIDVAACPGSGKTTLLVAKLAILAEKWEHRTRGICVLSHTNAARREIETRLGNNSVGRRLLSYPHFIGTIHGFVDDFLALPWLRSQGYTIKLIDTEVCLKRRWSTLPPKIRSGLEKKHRGASILSIKSPDFNVGDIQWGKNGVLGRDTQTYRELQDTCRRSVEDGYFCYEEMFVWARHLMSIMPDLNQLIRDRFPLLFVDEAQDNSEDQSVILNRIFMQADRPVIRQRFGDSNQAIYGFNEGVGATTDAFPDDSTRVDLPSSHRFGQRIADFADPLGLISYTNGLKGLGPRNNLDSGAQEGPHTIFLFTENSIHRVLPAYGALLLETFSERELRDGSFTAVGQVHKDKGDDHKPRHVGHYWSDYDSDLSRADPKPQTFIQYVMAGIAAAEKAGETYPAVNKISEGILRLSGMTEGRNSIPLPKHAHRHVLSLLEDHTGPREHYQKLTSEFTLKWRSLTQEEWEGVWRGFVCEIAGAVAGISPVNDEANHFLSWIDGLESSESRPEGPKRNDNYYRYSNNCKMVSIRLGSIHSVKGETHTAMLVLETFFYQHSLASIRDWLFGTNRGVNGSRARVQNCLKVHYVAMTRPAHLLCLAMKQDTLGEDCLEMLKQRGWQVRIV